MFNPAHHPSRSTGLSISPIRQTIEPKQKEYSKESEEEPGEEDRN